MTDQPAMQEIFYLSPNGSDQWSGRSPDPLPGGADGPLATLQGARDAIRGLKERGGLLGPAVVYIRGGRYPVSEPVVFTPADSWPTLFTAYPGEAPVFDGGERVTGWLAGMVNGRAAWVADLPQASGGARRFRSLFVNGQRCPRARLPKVGVQVEQREFYWMESVPGLDASGPHQPDFRFGNDRFVARAGDFDSFRNLEDVEVVALHFWVEERMPVKSYDPATRTVVSSKRSIFRLTDDYNSRYAKYYIDNVFEGLTEPGEWYLDRPEGRLYYLPRPGENIDTAEIYAPRASQFLRFEGDPTANRWVEHLRFSGLVFEHADWVQSPAGWASAAIEDESEALWGHAEYAASPQAAAHVPGAVFLEGARFCSIDRCTLRHLGGYGIELGDGCMGIRVTGCVIADLGAGGIKANGANAGEPLCRRTGRNVFSDNLIAFGGRVFHSAIGILLRNSFENDVTHNHIHDFFYSGISCGWVWGYAESVSRDNHIDYNHIHHLGFGWLSDMGGIYTLGVQPGTTLNGNWIHDIESASYGGWAIYPDEGSAHLVIENNICHDTTQQPFHEHYGRENIIRNNVFAFGQKAQVALSRADPHRSFTFSKNIIITMFGVPVFTGGYGADLRKRPFGSDLNLFYSPDGAPITVSPVGGGAGDQSPSLSFDEWQALGFDRHSLVTDPLFEDLPGRNFRLKPGSLAFSLGFTQVDVTLTGPRIPVGAE